MRSLVLALIGGFWVLSAASPAQAYLSCSDSQHAACIQQNGSGYGCYNENGNNGNGTAVDCDNTGHCIGTERTGLKTKGVGGATILGRVLR